MHLYKCSASGTGCDEYDEVVVRARNPEHALEMVTARKPSGYPEFPGFAFDSSNVTVTEVTPDGVPGVICASFNAG